MHRSLSWILAGTVVFVSCADPMGPTDGTVGVRFASSSGAVSAAPDGVLDLIIGGSNGTLEIEDVWFVVAEFELEGEDDNCPDSVDDCNEFDAPPAFLQLPLQGGETPVVRFKPQMGVYDKLEFEIERLDDDDDEVQERALLSEIRRRFPEWPGQASVLVVGTFTPNVGAARPFRTFIDAEIEIELDLLPPVEVNESAGAEFTVEVDPRLWFTGGAGQVLDLSAFDWDTTGDLLKLEVEFERGFRGVEIDD